MGQTSDQVLSKSCTKQLQKLQEHKLKRTYLTLHLKIDNDNHQKETEAVETLLEFESETVKERVTNANSVTKVSNKR
jgi:hypothetical protein